MTVTSTDIAASVASTCRDLESAMITYVKCPKGGRVRTDLVIGADRLHERLGHLLACLARKHGEER